MNSNKIVCFERILFVIVIILIPINHLPKSLSFSVWGETSALYPFTLLLSIVLWKGFKSHNWYGSKKLIYYFCISTIASLLALIHGLIIYPHYNLFEISAKLSFLISQLPFVVDDLVARKVWFALRMVVAIIKENMVFVGFAFSIMQVYRNNWQLAFKDIRKAILILVCFFGVYSVPEILWLKLNLPVAQMFLEKINPFLYDIAGSHGWWPPLLWKGQLRSLCAEPSFFGIISSFIIPFLWSYLIERHIAKYVLLYCYYMLMLFMTKARTGLGLFLGECVLLVISTLTINRKWLKVLILVFVATTIAFAVNLANWGISSKNQDAGQYVNDNVTSVLQEGARSNSARKINVFATIRVGIQHPLLGVGNGLTTTYITENLPESAYTNNEVCKWVEYSETQGVLKSGYPTLNQYGGIFAKNGIVGLIIFLLPLEYIIWKLWNKRQILFNFKIVCIVIAFCGQLAAMFSNEYMLTYPLILGLLFCIVESKNDNDEKL